MRSVSRLTWAVGGFELRFLLVASLLAAAACLALALVLAANAPDPVCLTSNDAAASCDTAFFFQVGSLGSQLIVAMGILPLAVGGVLGIGFSAREIERGTVQLPWSLTPSRTRWLAERVLILLALIFMIVVIPALSTTVLEGQIDPAVDANATLVDFGFRGPSVVGRAIAIFAVASLIGLAIGRTLPALLLSFAAGAAIIVLLPPLALAVQPTEVIAPLGDPQVRYGVVREERLEDASGSLFTIDEVTAIVPPGTDDPTSWIEANFRQVAMGVRGERYWNVEMASFLILGALTLASFGGAAILVSRRRPY